MARSIGRTYRLVRLAAIGGALASVALAGGCSAGQLAATSQVVPAVPGGFATATPDAQAPLDVILVENAEIVFNPQGYPVGSTVPLSMRIFNQTEEPITVASGTVTIQVFGSTSRPTAGTLAWATSASSAADAVASSASPSPSVSTSPSVSPSESATPPAPTEAPSPTPAPTIPPITIQPSGFVILTPEQMQYLTITNLTQPLMPGTIINITLNFTTGNGMSASATVSAGFAPPASPAARVSVAPSS